jgi:DNA-binding GntR family transcriptional regulator
MRVQQRRTPKVATGSSKIDRSTAAVYENLRSLISEKRFAPGSKINQSKLATQFQVSRTPVVKALHKLETQGLVDNVPRRGFFVHQLSILELLDLFALREALDTIIISELTETISEEQIKELEAVFQCFDEGTNSIDESQYWECDKVFHRLLLRISTNNLAKKIDEHFQIFNRAFIGGLVRKPAATLPEHRKIILALKEKDRDAAVEATISHVHESKSFLQEIVKKLQKLGIDPAKIPFTELPQGTIDVLNRENLRMRGAENKRRVQRR